MASRDDVARLAGVSGATVSYVLNDKPGVKISDKTREAVLAAAAELNYRPSMAARTLVTGTYDQIGVLMPAGDLHAHVYHTKVLNGAWLAAQQLGIRLVLDSIREDGSVSFVEQRFVDGLILPAIGRNQVNDALQHALSNLQIPVVVTGTDSMSSLFHTIDIDNDRLGSDAAQRLWDMGHRRFMVFGGLTEHLSVMERRDGFTSRIAKLSEGTSVVAAVDSPYEGMQTAVAAAEALQANPKVTGVFCFNDVLAGVLVDAAASLGRRVPRDLSVLGVDALDPQPDAIKISSFGQPLEAMGRWAVEQILSGETEPQTEIRPFYWRPGDTHGPPAVAVR